MGSSVANPEGEGRCRSQAPLGGTSAAAGDDVDTDDAEVRDDETVAPLAVILSCDMPASTHVGELWRAARRRSARDRRERFPERPLRRAGVEIGRAHV